MYAYDIGDVGFRQDGRRRDVNVSIAEKEGWDGDGYWQVVQLG